MKKFIVFSTILGLSFSCSLLKASDKKRLREDDTTSSSSSAPSPKRAKSTTTTAAVVEIPEGYFGLKVEGGERVFTLPIEAARLSVYLSTFFEDGNFEDGNGKIIISIPSGSLRSEETLEKIIDLMMRVSELKAQHPEYSQHQMIRVLYDVVDASSLNYGQATNLLNAIHYLDMPLLDKTIQLYYFCNFPSQASSPEEKAVLIYETNKYRQASYPAERLSYTELVSLGILPDKRFTTITEFRSYMRHPIARSYPCVSNQEMVRYVREYIAQAITAGNLPPLPELIAQFEAEPLTTLYITLFIEYYLQTHAEGAIFPDLDNAETLSRVAKRIRDFKDNQDPETTLDLIHISEIGTILAPLLQIIEQLTQRPILKLNLYRNNLTELPASIGNLTQLEWLNFNDNQLTALPAEFCKLTQLRELFLSLNGLTIVPAELGNLTQLQDLEFHYNILTEVPVWIDKLTQLRRLGLRGNKLTTLPAELGNLTQLRSLYLSKNLLRELPASLDRPGLMINKDPGVVFAAA